MSKHTPGPWVIGNDGYNANTVCAGNTGVCQMYGVPMNARVDDVGERYAVGMANARLISAAPDMYEALSLLMRIMQAEDPWDRENLGSMNEACMKARAALSKAQGVAVNE